ncbi:lipocalin-like domain-containing protein [Parasphingorhabdus sp.]|uniref:lipocalin-like domain-containing protein n=1 Tax=Parasphingorhabdus sp. TaxID=2709688 RepID=UPI003D2C2FAB
MYRITAVVMFLGLFLSAATWAYSSQPIYPEVTSGEEFAFPRDHGSHDAFRTEWWYFTGWLETADGDPLGFQITFFRSRPEMATDNPSKFAPQQIIFAHAALSDPQTGKLIHDQRIGRAGFEIIEASQKDADVSLLDWQLTRTATGVFASKVTGQDFALDLKMEPSQIPMLNGENGYSRKGLKPSQASYYYSVPQLKVGGSVIHGGKKLAVTGRAWLDREWSSDVLPENAVGWDWTGLNFDDGSALMAFQVRGADGDAVYAGGSFRSAEGKQIILSPDDIQFKPRRIWTSPETGADYPVEAEFVVRLDGEWVRYHLEPMFDAQELSGAFTPTYWEGAVSTSGGRGYLEMTGYAGKIAL